MMRRLLATLTLAMLAPCNIGNAAPEIFPGHLAVTYSLYTKGARIASMERVVSQADNGDFVYRSETRTTGLMALFRRDHIVEQSVWTMVGDALRPLQYLYQRRGGHRDRNVSVKFDWEAQRIINTINGDSWRMPTEPNVMDNLLYQLAVMHDLKSGRASLTYTVADGGKIKVYDFERLGEETVSTPLGKWQTLKLSRHKQESERQTTLWCASALNYLPVKVENIEPDGNTTVAIIESVSGIGN